MALRATGRVLVFSVFAPLSPFAYTAQSAAQGETQADSNASPISGVQVPTVYRDWHLVSVKRLTGAEGGLLRAELGNDFATEAFREGSLPFPGIAALHWNEAASDAESKVLAEGCPGAGLESTFAGSAISVQFIVKDSKKYSATDGRGFAGFTSGGPGNEALHKTSFSCHEPAKDHDFVFTCYALTP